MANTVAEAEDDGTRLIQFRVGESIGKTLDWVREVTELGGDGDIFAQALGLLKWRIKMQREGTEVKTHDILGARTTMIPFKVKRKKKPKLKRPRRGPQPK